MDHRGISAVAGAVTLVMKRSWKPGLIDSVTPGFKSYRSKDLNDPMTTGLSVLVHLVTEAPRLHPVPQLGSHERPGLSVQVHFLLTAWGESASVEQSLLGWGASALAQHPVLETGLLNEAVPGACEPGENVQIRADYDYGVSQLWHVLPCPMQLSLPYVTSEVYLDHR